MNLIELEKEIKERVDSLIESEQSNPTSSGFNTASELGYECDRYQVARRIAGDKRRRVSLGLAKIFRMGNILEKPTIDLIRKAGYPIYEDPSTSSYEWPKYQIKGKIDAKMELKRDKKIDIIPVEVKTCGRNYFNSVVSLFESGKKLYESDRPVFKKWSAQIQIYQLLFDVDVGLFVFVDKEGGDLFFKFSELDYDYAEALIQRAERTNAYVARGELPEPTYKELCLKCDFCDTLCFPDRSFGPGYELIIDQAVEEQLSKLKELEKSVREYEALKNSLIGSQSKPGLLYGKNLIIGNYIIEAVERKQTRYDVPDEIKNQFKVESKYLIHKIETIGDDVEK